MHTSCTHCRADVGWKHDAQKKFVLINSSHMKYYLVITLTLFFICDFVKMCNIIIIIIWHPWDCCAGENIVCPDIMYITKTCAKACKHMLFNTDQHYLDHFMCTVHTRCSSNFCSYFKVFLNVFKISVHTVNHNEIASTNLLLIVIFPGILAVVARVLGIVISTSHIKESS